MIDLHTHSNVSDGDLSPALLVQEAIRRGVRAIALTDHDTVDGLEGARTEAAAGGLHLIPGIEIGINWTAEKSPQGVSGLGPGGEFHLLGLGIKAPTPAFTDAVKKLSRRREERNRKILDRMYELSIDATWDELLAISGGGSVGRVHFASLLIKRKIVKNTEQAFARFLGVGKPLYVPKEGLDFEEAAALIRESAGLPVLAHPMSLFIAWGRLPELVKALKERGLLGIEAWHPAAKAASCRRLEALGKSLGLYITEG
ncbi:MAG: PHP domain-containing protein, partial [Treponema sp.]|nr:PHP domain-containing protein [Treponema sp.]